MAEDKTYTIERSLEGDTIYFIARNNAGVIIGHETTLEKLQAYMKTYKEPPPPKEEGEQDVKPKEKKFLKNELLEKVQKRKEEKAEQKEMVGITTPKESIAEEEKKQLLQNELAAKVQERKEQEEKSQKKKSFWDKLK